MTITIREVDMARLDHLDAAVALHRECFLEKELDISMFTTGHWWFAFDGETPVAFAGLHRSVRWSDVGYLCRAGVSESARGMGLQKRLIRVRLAKARRLGWNYVITDTRRNPASANSLISMGFRMYQPQRPWSFKDACYWRKNL